MNNLKQKFHSLNPGIQKVLIIMYTALYGALAVVCIESGASQHQFLSAGEIIGIAMITIPIFNQFNLLKK